MKNEVPGDRWGRWKVIPERVRRRRVGRDYSFLFGIVVESSFRGCGVLSGEVPPLSVLLLQSVKKLGKLHLDALGICAELFKFRVNGFNLDGYMAGFLGEVFQVCLFQGAS